MSVTQGGVVRPGPDRRDLHRRGPGRRDRERQHLRAGRRGLDPGRRQGPAGRRPAADGHGLDQRLPPVRAAGGVGRLQAVRHRPRARRWPAWRSTARPSTSGTTSAPPSSAGSRAESRRADGHQGPVRRRHRGWRVGRVRAGQPALRRQRHQRPGPGGRPLRLEDRPVHPHARGAAVPHRQPLLRLALPDRPRAGPGRPAGRARARQGARRLVEHQRDDLPARQPDGLRALGGRARA